MNLIAGAILWLAAAIMLTGACAIMAWGKSDEAAAILAIGTVGCIVVGIKLFLGLRFRRLLDAQADAPKN